MGDKTANKILVGKPQWKKSLDKSRPRLDDNIKTGIRKVGYEDAQ
jgi:hypothetical protein